ncbi:MAG: GcrA family cell cycle regulator [Patescibacteria group bacterium]
MSSWTDERVEKLKKLWAEGMSASQIAKSLGGVTRNGVIGKIHRLGLTSRQSEGEKIKGGDGEENKQPKNQPETIPLAVEASPARPSQRPRPGNPFNHPRKPIPQVDEAAERKLAEDLLSKINPQAKKLSLLELTERTCKWPIGDPAEENFYFCGLPCAPGKPYCEHHVAVAYQPLATIRSRRRGRGRRAS